MDVKPNRGDALSMVGWPGRWRPSPAEPRLPDASVREDPSLAAADHVSVEIVDPAACPRFAARWLDDVQNGASPPWMQQRLLAAGMRPISAVVDVTNYVMHELGQPMHAYDAETVPDGQIVVRRARAGETLETIDHERRALDERMLVIADREQPIGLAGIMGGAGTEVTSETRRVIPESAIFHGPTIRNTARRLGLRSEASMRHEKGIGHGLRYAADRAVRLMAEITGARVASGIVDNDPEPAPARGRGGGAPRTAAGDLVAAEEVVACCARWASKSRRRPAGGDGAGSSARRGGWEDVAEEVARAHGCDRIPGRLPEAALPPYRPDPPSRGIGSGASWAAWGWTRWCCTR